MDFSAILAAACYVCCTLIPEVCVCVWVGGGILSAVNSLIAWLPCLHTIEPLNKMCVGTIEIQLFML